MSGDDVPGGVPALPERVRAALAQAETWAEPPPGLKTDVLTALRRARSHTSQAGAAGVPVQAGTGPPDELAAQRDARARRPKLPRRRSYLAAAVLAAVITGAALAVVQDQQTPTTVLVLASTGLAPGASGRADIRSTASGFEIELDADKLPPAPEGSYYQAWLRNDAGDLITIGTFHARQGSQDIILWSGVNPQQYPTLTVTLQQEGAGATSSGRVFLRGTLP